MLRNLFQINKYCLKDVSPRRFIPLVKMSPGLLSRTLAGITKRAQQSTLTKFNVFGNAMKNFPFCKLLLAISVLCLTDVGALVFRHHVPNAQLRTTNLRLDFCSVAQTNLLACFEPRDGQVVRSTNHSAAYGKFATNVQQ